MRLLLDSHVVVWWLTDDATLSDEVKSLIDDEPDVFVSAATVWELAIKQSLGRIEAPREIEDLVRDSEVRELPVRFEHAGTAGRLPLLHRDPFDRMLVAQAQCERLTLLTRDSDIQKYDVATLTV